MKNLLFIPEQNTPDFFLPAHTITWRQDLSQLKNTFLENKDLDTFLHFYEVATKHPEKVKKELEQFRNKYPNHPHVLNLLTGVYVALRKVKQANRLIEENYQKNPESLFAKINFADLCLRKKKAQNIPEIFNHRFHLPALYPDRKIFHVSEFRGFMVLMGWYHLFIQKRKTAKEYHLFAAYVDPKHPGTQWLGKQLYHLPLYKRIILKLCPKKENARY